MGEIWLQIVRVRDIVKSRGEQLLLGVASQLTERTVDLELSDRRDRRVTSQSQACSNAVEK
jgi:hypothetical protein